MEDEIIVPTPGVISDDSDLVDGPKPVLMFQYNLQFGENESPIILRNETSFILEPSHYKKIKFNIVVSSNLPAVSVIYQDNMLFRMGITCVVNPIQTNDIPLFVTVFNYRDEPIKVEKGDLHFWCRTILGIKTGRS